MNKKPITIALVALLALPLLSTAAASAGNDLATELERIAGSADRVWVGYSVDLLDGVGRICCHDHRLDGGSGRCDLDAGSMHARRCRLN